MLASIEIVYYTGHGGFAGFHVLSALFSLPLVVGAGYGFLSLLHDVAKRWGETRPPEERKPRG